MSYVVIAYPKISRTDFVWIQAVRREYNLMQFRKVKPHITFVFPTQKLTKEALIKHVQSKLSKAKTFDIRLNSAKVVEDDSKTYFHAFLIPSVGFEEVNTLHDLLYTGDLESELRKDIPFIPHLGVGDDQDAQVMAGLADKLNAEARVIEGHVDALTVVESDGSKVTDVIKIPLL